MWKISVAHVATVKKNKPACTSKRITTSSRKQEAHYTLFAFSWSSPQWALLEAVWLHLNGRGKQLPSTSSDSAKTSALLIPGLENGTDPFHHCCSWRTDFSNNTRKTAHLLLCSHFYHRRETNQESFRKHVFKTDLCHCISRLQGVEGWIRTDLYNLLHITQESHELHRLPHSLNEPYIRTSHIKPLELFSMICAGSWGFGITQIEAGMSLMAW